MDYSNPREIVTANSRGKNTKVCNATIYDESKACIMISFWNEIAESLDNQISEGDILVIKSATVSNYATKSLTCGNNSVVMINPGDIKQCKKLFLLKTKSGIKEELENISDRNF